MPGAPRAGPTRGRSGRRPTAPGPLAASWRFPRPRRDPPAVRRDPPPTDPDLRALRASERWRGRSRSAAGHRGARRWSGPRGRATRWLPRGKAPYARSPPPAPLRADRRAGAGAPRASSRRAPRAAGPRPPDCRAARSLPAATASRSRRPPGVSARAGAARRLPARPLRGSAASPPRRGRPRVARPSGRPAPGGRRRRMAPARCKDATRSARRRRRRRNGSRARGEGGRGTRRN